MDTCDTMFSATHLLIEQIAHLVFDVLPERGPVLIVMDRDGSYWPSNPEEFAKLNLSDALLRDLRAKVDDGAEPVLTQVGDVSVTIAQLATDRTNCGYVVVALPRHSPENTLTNIDLVEALVNQITLIARLVEKSRMLTQSHVNHYAAYSASDAVSN
jgi:hypothetical protein